MHIETMISKMLIALNGMDTGRTKYDPREALVEVLKRKERRQSEPNYDVHKKRIVISKIFANFKEKLLLEKQYNKEVSNYKYLIKTIIVFCTHNSICASSKNIDANVSMACLQAPISQVQLWFNP